MKTKKVILYNDEGKVLETFEGVQGASFTGKDGADLTVDFGEDVMTLQGIKINCAMLEADAEVGGTVPEGGPANSIEIQREKSDVEVVEDIKAGLDGAVRIINEMSRQFIKSDALTEEQRGELVAQFRQVEVGDTIQPGEVVQIQGKLYEMIKADPVTIHAENWLGGPSIFADFINPTTPDGGTVVAEFKQPTGAHDAYQAGDVVMFDGVMYESVMDNNVYSPADYPQGWQSIEG